MDKTCQSSDSSSSSSSNTNTNINTKDHYLKNLNKLSTNKISKPIILQKKPPSFDHQIPNQQPSTQLLTHTHNLPPQQQPPVYNINKNDFRDVVQRLTGSPAHERFHTPPPIQPPKAASSRLQRIRPPPLVHVSNRPPTLLNDAAPTTQPARGFIQRPVVGPLSPLPPLPSVHAAAESPVSAYMRFLHNHNQSSMASVNYNVKQLSGFSPLSCPPPPPTQYSSGQQLQLQFPISPLPFGCANSPRSPYAYPLLSPGHLGFPLSPRVQVQVPSPKWKSR